MKNFRFLIFLLYSINVVADNSDQCQPNELNGVQSVYSSSTTRDWLFQSFNTQSLHPNAALITSDPNGLNCEFSIQVTQRDSIVEDRAYYQKNHNDPEQINFRFILDTESLLQSFVSGDTMILYNFTYKNPSNIDKLFMKVRLTKKDYDAANPNINQWEFKIQWKDTVNGGSVHQQYLFSDADQFVEFEFFWKKLTSTNALKA